MVSKAHNFYLDIAFGCGLPALIVLLALFALFFLKEHPPLKPDLTPDGLPQRETVLRFAGWLCCVSLMVQFLVNDQSIALGIIFWLMTGLYLSLSKGDA